MFTICTGCGVTTGSCAVSSWSGALPLPWPRSAHSLPFRRCRLARRWSPVRLRRCSARPWLLVDVRVWVRVGRGGVGRGGWTCAWSGPFMPSPAHLFQRIRDTGESGHPLASIRGMPWEGAPAPAAQQPRACLAPPRHNVTVGEAAGNLGAAMSSVSCQLPVPAWPA